MFFFTISFLLLGISLSKYFLFILVISATLSLIESFVYIFNENKYQYYLKEFNSTKKYDFPLTTFLFIITILCLWFYIFLILI